MGIILFEFITGIPPFAAECPEVYIFFKYSLLSFISSSLIQYVTLIKVFNSYFHFVVKQNPASLNLYVDVDSLLIHCAASQVSTT